MWSSGDVIASVVFATGNAECIAWQSWQRSSPVCVCESIPELICVLLSGSHDP
jgi:hypothetical protein